MKYFSLFAMVILLMACNGLEPALSVSHNPSLKNYKVKGRQGFLINQKLDFGEYKTSKVKRSWTKGSDLSFPLPIISPNAPVVPDMFSLEFSDRHQTFSFQMTDSKGHKSQAFAASNFESENLQIGNNPNSVVNILKDVFGVAGFSQNLFYLQLFMENEPQPWQLVIDNQASQRNAGTYEDIFAYDDNHYYTLKPITEVMSKKGPRKIPMGSVGYEIFNPKKESVAAVLLVDAGNVYLNTQEPQERFLMANLCAALLLQQDVAE